MFIDAFNNNGKIYLRLVESYRTVDDDGKQHIRRRIICNLGPLSRFDDGQPDYLERLRASFRNATPLIPELEEYVKKQSPRETYRFQIEEGDPDCIAHPRLFADALLEMLLTQLGLADFFRSYKGFNHIQYDLLGFVRLLVFGRVLNPDSKFSTVAQNEDYYRPILKSHNPYNVYDTLDFLYANKDKIKRRMNTAIVKKLNRNPKVIFYDVTNFFFEIDKPDAEDGVRKCGVSKEERKLPIVQMGLFMDDQGLPISIEMFPGNTLDGNTFKSAISKSVETLDYSRFILIGDRGMCSYQNILHLLDQKNGYIISKSLLKSSAKDQEWAYADADFIEQSKDFKYKSRVVKRSVQDAFGSQREISEKVIVYWSRKFYERELQEHARFLDTLQKILESPKSFRVTSLQAKSIRPFLKSELVNTKTGEALESSVLRAMIDEEKVEAYKARLGFYQIVTSGLEMEPLDVIEKYHGLSRIEDQFRVMKSQLETRPMYVRTPEHIEAHLLICLIALTMIRMIQCQICKSGLAVHSHVDALWNMGLPADRIQRALNKWKVENLPGGLFRFCDIDDPDLKRILDAFHIQLPCKLYTKAQLNSIKADLRISS